MNKNDIKNKNKKAGYIHDLSFLLHCANLI